MAEVAQINDKGTLIQIGDFDLTAGKKPGWQLLPVERVSAGSTSTLYTKITVTQGIVGGKWRITTTVADLAGQELADAKTAVVSNTDLTMAEAFRWTMNYLYAKEKVANPGLLKSDFLAAFTAAQTAPGGTPANQTPITRAQTLSFLTGLL